MQSIYTAKPKIETVFGFSKSITALVYRDKNFVLVSEGVPLERGRQRGVPSLKRRYFTAIGSYNEKTVADTRVIPKVSGLDILDNKIFHNLYISETYILYKL